MGDGVSGALYESNWWYGGQREPFGGSQEWPRVSNIRGQRLSGAIDQAGECDQARGHKYAETKVGRH